MLVNLIHKKYQTKTTTTTKLVAGGANLPLLIIIVTNLIVSLPLSLTLLIVSHRNLEGVDVNGNSALSD